jgi:uncharacterized protein (DUF58 family)
MGTRALSDLGVSEAEVVRLRRLGDRLLAGSAMEPHGTSPRKLRAGRGIEFLELRTWAQGDETQHIDWRATARSPRPLVRRYQDEALATVLVCLDRSASMAIDPTKWHVARQLAAALAYLMSSGGHAVGFLAFSTRLDVLSPPARGRASQVRLLLRLARTEPRASGGDSRLEVCAPLVTPGATVFVISDFLTADCMRAGLDRLRHRGGRTQAFQILSPGETSVAGSGRVVLRDVETMSRRQVDLTSAAREHAVRTLAELQGALRSYCRTNGIALTADASRIGWRDLLLRHVRALGHV